MGHAFALALLLCLAAAQGGHAQVIVAQLSVRLGRSAGVLAAAVGASSLTAAAMAVLGAELRAALPAIIHLPLAAAALLAAAIALAMPLRRKPLREPTRSLGAIALALILRQAVDAPRLCMLALATLLGSTWPIAAGGALGCGFAVAIGWALGERLEACARMRSVRLVVGAVLAAWAIIILHQGLAGIASGL
ncbi:MAG: hypothetical protein A3J40_03965 [Erythrobacter sp. RIFCSPHIGHO2_12_FULL_63_10]|nr:MAG: hypothetical protein A3J40_03965 [Erythrobacter sp. RIFCSPHIGHO2_12_FULL_63_10]